MNHPSYLWVPLGAAFLGAVSALSTGANVPSSGPMDLSKHQADPGMMAAVPAPPTPEPETPQAGPAPSNPDPEVGGSLEADPHPAISTEEVAPIPQVSRAEGERGKTILEVRRDRKALEGRVVRVRAIVVKAIEGVMGKNFLHLRDGSNSAPQGDLDLRATSDELPQIGSTVLLEGTVKADVDLGANLRYDVLLEGAHVLDPALPP